MYRFEIIKNYNHPNTDLYDDALWCCLLERVTPLNVEDNLFKAIDLALKPYGGINVNATGYLDFPTEEDALAFKLQWLV